MSQDRLSLSTWPMVRGAGHVGSPSSAVTLSPVPPQGTTVRMITAIDQDKGRPRGIGYTIVSGECRGTGDGGMDYGLWAMDG